MMQCAVMAAFNGIIVRMLGAVGQCPLEILVNYRVYTLVGESNL